MSPPSAGITTSPRQLSPTPLCPCSDAALAHRRPSPRVPPPRRRAPAFTTAGEQLLSPLALSILFAATAGLPMPSAGAKGPVPPPPGRRPTSPSPHHRGAVPAFPRDLLSFSHAAVVPVVPSPPLLCSGLPPCRPIAASVAQAARFCDATARASPSPATHSSACATLARCTLTLCAAAALRVGLVVALAGHAPSPRR
ncbi:WAS/WASL-interacting protein family member 1-like [Oryza brachyantha]|uniref:WAS/WASL-interacting protein family member 1-like n=1 Tax=Oryza brachyantha TaxID=4533 RepID=UPI001ADB8F43|nr:WAS/WASL-interacting protein family member 1-like [Oryza brachyantha]